MDSRTERRKLRVMTYNVHSCIGMDFKRSEARVAEVIARFEPDVVGLQELDMKRARSRHVEQAHLIAKHLGFHFVFNAALEIKGEQYGDAILSRHPFKIFQTAPLPFGPHFLFKETRGAIGVELLDCGVRIINTHLGLGQTERVAQAKALAGTDWIGACRGPAILMGDFNSLRGSPPFRILTGRLRDAGAIGIKGRRATYPSSFPTISIDHIFTSAHFSVTEFFIPNDQKTRIASDHLPVIATLEFTAGSPLSLTGKDEGTAGKQFDVSVPATETPANDEIAGEPEHIGRRMGPEAQTPVSGITYG